MAGDKKRKGKAVAEGPSKMKKAQKEACRAELAAKAAKDRERRPEPQFRIREQPARAARVTRANAEGTGATEPETEEHKEVEAAMSCCST